jgi:predicted ATP-grasp superfamily ATP-dependent carboligase
MASIRTLLIAGSSTRAAAFSAMRAGLTPHCIDHFADRDLAEACTVSRVEPGAGIDEWTRAASRMDADAWCYTGPLENRPELVDELSRRHRLAGNPRSTLGDVRDPFQVLDVLRRHQLPRLDVKPPQDDLPRDGSWVIKPLASGGGRLIERYVHDSTLPPEPCYLQEYRNGPSFSALYVADQGRAELIGVTRQLVGIPGQPFAYRGSLGPWPLAQTLRAQLERLGVAITSTFHLLGLFGIDFVLLNHEPWLVEVNPRYTASVEVLELALGLPLLADHLVGCGLDSPGGPGSRRSVLIGARPQSRSPGRDQFVVGKTILFARRRFVVPEINLNEVKPTGSEHFTVPALADIPWPGTPVNPGDPIMTVFATGAHVSECERVLKEREHHWLETLEG